MYKRIVLPLCILCLLCLAAPAQEEKGAAASSPESEVTAKEQAAPAAPDRPVDFSLAIEASLDTAEWKIEGVERATWFNRSAGDLSEVVFLCPPNAWANEEALACRFRPEPPLAGERSDPSRFGYVDIRKVAASDGRELSGDAVRIQGTVMRITLPEPLPPGKSAELAISFAVKLPGRAFCGFGVAGRHVDALFWYPRPARYEGGRWIADLSDPASLSGLGSFDVVLTVPAHFLVAANGTLKESRVENAVKHLRFTADAIQDFCWAADPTAKEAEGLHESTRITVLGQPYMAEEMQPLLEEALFCLDFSKRYLTPPPFDQLVISTTPYGMGGMVTGPGFAGITQPFPTQWGIGYEGASGPQRELLRSWSLQSLPPDLSGGPDAATPLREGLARYLYLKLLEMRHGDATEAPPGTRAALEARIGIGILNDGFGILPPAPRTAADGPECPACRGLAALNLISMAGYGASPFYSPQEAGTLLGYRISPADDSQTEQAALQNEFAGCGRRCRLSSAPGACALAYEPLSGQVRPSAAAGTALALRTLENHIGWEALSGILKDFLAPEGAGSRTAEHLVELVKGRAGPEAAALLEALFQSREPLDFAVVEARCRPAAPARGYRTQSRISDPVTERFDAEEPEGVERVSTNPLHGLLRWGGGSTEEPAPADAGAESPAGGESAAAGMHPGWDWSVTVCSRGGAALPATVVLRFEGGKTERMDWDGKGRILRLEGESPARLVSAAVDPEARYAVDPNRWNNERSVEAQGKEVLFFGGWLQFWVQQYMNGWALFN